LLSDKLQLGTILRKEGVDFLELSESIISRNACAELHETIRQEKENKENAV